MTTTTTDVRVWSIRINDGARGKTYNVRWIVAGGFQQDTQIKAGSRQTAC